MGKPFAVVEYCYVNNFNVNHESYQATAPDQTPGAAKGATVSVKMYRVFAVFQYDLLDASKVLINRSMSKLVLRDGLTSDVTASALLDIVASSAQAMKDHIASVKSEKSGFVA